MRNTYAPAAIDDASSVTNPTEVELESLIGRMIADLSVAVERSVDAKGAPLSPEMAEVLEDFANAVYDHVESIRLTQHRRHG